MVEIAICVGSSCHLKGSHDVIEAFTEEVKKRSLTDKVELKAAFCLGKCGYDGVSVKVNDKIVTGVTPATVSSFFDQEVLPLIH
jgi:NADH:ubiquinone oxidoreductase subunit E